MAEDLEGRLVADKYRVGAFIRTGGSGDLFAAHNEVLDKPVLIQILPLALSIDARWSRKFIDSSRTASSVTHPNILNVIDFGTDARGVTYAVFEAASTTTIADLGTEGQVIDPDRVIGIGRQIAAAISAAHEKNVVHGRLKPTDIFLETSEDGTDSVKIFGFGSDPMNVGNDDDPRYLAPEQCTAFPTADARTDVYSLGVIIYELLSGVAPFDAESPSEILTKVNAAPPPPLSAFRRDLHPELEPILLTALASDRENRYQTIVAFADDLDMVSGTAEKAVAATTNQRRNVWQTAVISVVGISVLAGALIYATSARQTDPMAFLQSDPESLPVQPIGPATGAQEENLAKLPELTEAEILASGADMNLPGTIDGGDGYNAWANGGAPPPGAPPPMYFPQGGQVVTIDPNTGSPFMPNESGIILVPIPANTVNDPATRPSPTPGTPGANTATDQPTPTTAATPRTFATPPPRNTRPAKTPPAKPPATNEEGDNEGLSDQN